MSGLQLLNDAPYPQNDPLTLVQKNHKGDLEGFLNEQQWGQWFLALQNNVNVAPARVGETFNLSAQNGAIVATDIGGGILPAGVYVLSYWLRVTVPAGISSSLQVTFTWTTGGFSQAFVGVVVNGNTQQSYASESVPAFRIDAGSPITVAVAYASNPAAQAQFEIDVILQRLQVTE